MEKGIILPLTPECAHTHKMHDRGCRCCHPDPARPSASCQAANQRAWPSTSKEAVPPVPHTPSCEMGKDLHLITTEKTGSVSFKP